MGDVGLIPGWGRSPGGEHGNPLPYSCLENPLDRGAWWAWDHKELDTTQYTHQHTRKLTQLIWGFMQTTRVFMNTMSLGQISLPPPLLGAFPFPLFSLPSPPFFLCHNRIPQIGRLKQNKCIYQSLEAEKVLAYRFHP